MKYCPVCSARYDEEIIRFCTKDGTPLLDEKQPNFTTIPSEAVADEPDDEIGQETVIRRKPLVPPDQPLTFDDTGRSERIVIPTSEPTPGPNVRARTAQGYVVPPPPPNTAKTVMLTILGTLGVVGLGILVFWMLRGDPPANVNANINVNANQNANLNTNLSFDSNFNFNLNTNTNSNLNTNFNAPSNLNINVNTNTNTNSRPTPTPRLSPSPSPAPTASPTPANTATPRPANTTTRPANSQPTPLGTPRTGPRPPPLANRPTNGNG